MAAVEPQAVKEVVIAVCEPYVREWEKELQRIGAMKVAAGYTTIEEVLKTGKKGVRVRFPSCSPRPMPPGEILL